MPNWCEQDLVITCEDKDKKELAKFFKKYGKKLETSEVIPYPESLKTRTKEFNESKELQAHWSDAHQYWFNNEGYEWCATTWGSKWGVSDWYFDSKDENELKFTFQSAWSPCCPVILALSKKFPNLEFTLRYFECGCAFNGIYVCKGGEVIQEDSGAYFGDRGG